MKLVVFSHKLVWQNTDAPSGYATDGGFAFHMKAISEIFDETIVAVPVSAQRMVKGEVLIGGHNLKIYPLQNIAGRGMKRKLNYISWFFKHVFIFNKLINQADAVHVPIPSDIGALGMVLAKIKGKPLFVRHCGNWHVQVTRAEKFWKWFMEKYAGGKNVMLTTGLETTAPSLINKNIQWIFSSSVTNKEIEDLGQHLPVLDVSHPRLVIVCRMEPEKGPGRVITALNMIRDEFPDAHLDVVGDGPALPAFKELAQKLNLSDKVTFHGKLNHEGVLSTLQQAHIFCYPTTASEGFPKVVLEAMASGLPVLGTPVSAISKLLSKGGGILLKKESPEILADAIRIMLINPQNYAQMQNLAIETAKSFSLENWRDTIKNHLKPAWGLK